MKADDIKELLRLVELEYERTTKFIEGSVGATTQVRGWAITVWAALVGLAFSTRVSSLALLAVVALIAFVFADAYYSALYQQGLRRAHELERITKQHFDALARGSDNPRVVSAANAALAANRYGLYSNLHSVRVRDLLAARPRVFMWVYGALTIVALLSAVVSFNPPSQPSPPASPNTSLPSRTP